MLQGQIRYIQASPTMCFGNEPFPSVSPAAKAPHRRRVSREAKHGWNLAMCKDYLTVGVVVIRKWLGLEGRAGLTPRDGAGADVLSALKVFMSCATRPRPAQVGAPPGGPTSCEAAFQDTSAARTSGKEGRGLSSKPCPSPQTAFFRAHQKALIFK